MKIVKRNQLKIVTFTATKNRCMLHGHVFVMCKGMKELKHAFSTTLFIIPPVNYEIF